MFTNDRLHEFHCKHDSIDLEKNVRAPSRIVVLLSSSFILIFNQHKTPLVVFTMPFCSSFSLGHSLRDVIQAILKKKLWEDAVVAFSFKSSYFWLLLLLMEIIVGIQKAVVIY
jgi:hypothetical protein